MAGSAESLDKFTPRLLDADVREDLSAVFAKARAISAGEDPAVRSGERQVSILTPGRAIVPVASIPQVRISAEMQERLGSRSRNIIVISYTRLDALMDTDNGKLKCIPFLPTLMAFAAAGHNVVVFEGHPSALETGLRDADVLVIDSAMLQFLQPDWMIVTVRAMRPGAIRFLCDRKTLKLVEIIPSPQPPGWRWKIVDGAASYAYCLLSVLGKQSGRSTTLSTGRAVPDPRTLTGDPAELEWISTFPFQYDRLPAHDVIEEILKMAGVRDDGPRLIPWLRSHYTLNARLAGDGGSAFCPFRLTLSGFGSRRHLEILRENF